MKKWELLGSEMAFDNRWFKVRRDTVKLPNGTILDDFFVWLEGQVGMVVGITKNDEVILVKQYKHAFGDMMIECSAGMINDGEDPLDGAKREFQEETGFSCGEFTFLGVYNGKATKTVGDLHIFLAEGVEELSENREHHLDETEEIEVLRIPFKTVFDMIRKREIVAVETIAALYLAAEKQGRITIH